MNKDLMLDIGKTIGIPFAKSILIPEAKKAGKKIAKNTAKKTAKKSILPTVSILTGAVAGYVLYQKKLKK